MSETFKNALHSWLSDALGISVIWAGQDAPAPDYPYATLQVIGERNIGDGDVSYTHNEDADAGSDMEPTVTGHVVYTVSVQVRNKSSVQGQPLGHEQRAKAYLNVARASLQLPRVKDALNAANIGFVRNHDFQNLDEVVNEGFVSRGSMDFEFTTTYTYTPTDAGISYVETAVISSDMSGAQNDDNINFTDEDFGG